MISRAAEPALSAGREIYMEWNEEKMPLFPRGITGFWEQGEYMGHAVSSAYFKQIVYTMASVNRMTVSCTDVVLTGKNFFWAAYQKYGKMFFLLMNSRYPYLAFADQMQFSNIHFVDHPWNMTLPAETEVVVLDARLLNRAWRGCIDSLSEVEVCQIRFWKPRTVGEIIFNFWD